jgi:DDE superfamily endonuclease
VVLLRPAQDQFKKNLRAVELEQHRPDIAEARSQWKVDQPGLDPKRLVFIDETGTSTNMARLRGREPRSARLVANVSYGHWKTTTFVTALRIGGVTAPCVIDGPTDGDIFRAFEQFLAPTLKRDDIVIMDNLAAHKVGGGREAIEARQATLRYLRLTHQTSIRSSK